MLTRRRFMKEASAIGGLLFAVPYTARAAILKPSPPSAFIRVAPDNVITLIIPRVEMGQGAYTSLPMLIAEEMEIGLDQVTLEAAPPDNALYADAINGEQATGTSATTMGFYDALRVAGATLRQMLVAAAAAEWKVPPGDCAPSRATITHAASGRTLTYGDVADKAARRPIPRHITLKPAKDFTLIGRSTKRLDAPDKVTGKAKFGIDVQLPDMLIATVAACPIFGGRLGSVDDTAAKAVNGVRQIVRLSDAVAVVADHMGAARKGLAALKIEWQDGPHAGLSSAEIVQNLATASERQGAVSTREGNVAAALKQAAQRIDAVYQLPFLAHAPMEPMNCTVRFSDGFCDIWVGTQVPVRAQAAAAKASGLPTSKIRVHNQLIGGGFGRRLFPDHVGQAVMIARQVDRPVKLIWTREEDIQHDFYRPYYYDRLSAGLDKTGKPVAWTHRVAGSSVSARWDPSSVKNGLDDDAVDSAAGPYAIPHRLIDYVREEPGAVPTGWWRGVGPTHNVFVVESFIDELAAAAGQDPVAYRRSLLDTAPRVRAVLDLAAAKAGWGRSLPPGHGHGVSVLASFGSFLAQIAEVSVDATGQVRVERVVCAVDCGQMVNPDTVKAQVEGGIIFGITAALYGEITIEQGRVVQGNFDHYRMLRIDEAPKIEVYLIESDAAPGGIGEPPTAAISPAVTNAIFAATGKRIRKLPVDPGSLRSA